MFTRSPPKPGVRLPAQTRPVQRAALPGAGSAGRSALIPMGSYHYAPGVRTGPLVNRTGLPDRLKSGVEALSGINLDPVRVHYNSPRPAGLQAHAYTQGSEIHLAPGQEKHLPHEAWHVVQQSQQRVAPTLQLKGARINDDASLEKEADVMGARALRTPASLDAGAAMATAAAAGCIQRVAILPADLTLEAIILFLQQVIAESGEVSIADQKRIFDFIGSMSRADNRALLPTFNELYRQPQYEEGGAIYKDIYESKKATKGPPKKKSRARGGKAVIVDNEFSDAESELSDNDLDIEQLYVKQPTLYQQAVDHSDANRVPGVINPRNTNMLAFEDRSLIPSSINGAPNTGATRKGKRKLSGKLKAGSDDLRAKQERLFFGSHLKQGGKGRFNSSIDKLKLSSRQDKLGSDPVKRLVSTSRKGFTIVDTEDHAEQSLLRSEVWDAIKKRLLQQIKASTASKDVPDVKDRSNAILLTFVLNRSSCRGCGLALSLALIEFWQELGAAMGDKLDWREVKKKYANRIRFVIRFPTIYEYDSENRIDFANLKEVLAGLIDAGWEIAPIRPNIKGGLDSYNKLVEILTALKAYPSAADFKYFLAGGAPRKPGGKSGEGPGVQPPLPQPAASVQRVAQLALRNYLTSIDAAWDQPFAVAPQGAVGGGGADGGVFAHQVVAHNPQDVLPPHIEPGAEALRVGGHGLQVHRNHGFGALCFIYSILMGLTGQSEDEVTPMVNYIAQQTGATAGWINADSPMALAVIAEVERIYATNIDLAVVQQGVGPIISARGGHAGGQVVVIRQTHNHYDAYVPR